MRGAAARGIVLGLLLSALLVCGAFAQRASFSGPPILGDKKISWSWEPIPGMDPYFQGNTVLDSVSVVMGPQPGRPFRLLEARRDGKKLFAVYPGDDRIFVFDPLTGLVDLVLDAPPDSLVDLEVHGTGQLVLGGLKDGRIAFWDLRTGTAPEVFLGHDARIRQVRFLGAGANVNEKGFVSAAAEDTMKIWLEPGSLLTRLAVNGNPTTALDVTTDAAVLAAGDENGRIRIFTLFQGQWNISRLLREHQSRIVQILFSADRKRMFSADAFGKLVGWSTATWSKSFEIQLDRAEGPLLGIRDPAGALVYTLDTTGYFQIYDGNDGRLYRSGQLIRSGTFHGAAFADIGRKIFLGLADGSILIYRTGFCEPSESNPECFGGYMLWRSLTPRAEDAVLLRVYGFGDSTWSFVGRERSFVDPDSLIPRGGDPEVSLAGPHNGMPYYYSITDFSKRYKEGSIFEVGWDLPSVQAGFFHTENDGPPVAVTAHRPARAERPLLNRVIVVPNPYEAGKVPWDAQLGEHVDFLNLPEKATIRIYTTAGDHLRTIEHASGAFGESSGRESWDLRNQRGEKVTSGVYLYHVKTPLSPEEAKGFFIVVR